MSCHETIIVPDPPLERVYTPKEAAEHLRLAESTLRRLIREGKIESFQPYCGARRLTESQLSRFIARASRDCGTGGDEFPPED